MQFLPFVTPEQILTQQLSLNLEKVRPSLLQSLLLKASCVVLL